jgi:hypothetical protein
LSLEYAIRCDGCGRLISSSRSSIRAARAEASLKKGANHGPDGDFCGGCRTKRIAELNRRARESGPAVSHSIGPAPGYEFGPTSRGRRKDG